MMLATYILTSVAGCGAAKPKTYPVEGKVVFKGTGKPLTGGQVAFEPMERTPNVNTNASGDIQSDGTFKLRTFEPGDGAAEGKHKVAVLPPAQDMTSDLEKKTKQKKSPIDRKYSEYHSSGLEFTVSSDPSKNKFTIEVSPP